MLDMGRGRVHNMKIVLTVGFPVRCACFFVFCLYCKKRGYMRVLLGDWILVCFCLLEMTLLVY